MRNENPNWSAYNGFAAAPPRAPASTTDPPPRRLSPLLMLGGITAAVAAGVAIGFVAQPAPVSAEKAEAAATPMTIELAKPAPPAPQPVAGKLDVRPTEVASAAAPRRLDVPAPAESVPAEPGPRMTERVQGPPVIREAPPREYQMDRPRYERRYEDEPVYEDEEDLPEPNPY